MLALAASAPALFCACESGVPEVHDLLDTSFTLAAGDVKSYGFGLQQGTRVFGNWTTDGAGVTFYVLDEDNHTRWGANETFSYRVMVEGSTGEFTFTVPDRGATYYYCWDNRGGASLVDVTVSLDEEK
jgi:hypothetical protein